MVVCNLAQKKEKKKTVDRMSAKRLFQNLMKIEKKQQQKKKKQKKIGLIPWFQTSAGSSPIQPIILPFLTWLNVLLI